MVRRLDEEFDVDSSHTHEELEIAELEIELRTTAMAGEVICGPDEQVPGAEMESGRRRSRWTNVAVY